MSHITTFDICYETRNKVSIREIIDLYLSFGWSIDQHGYISIRPLGDKDDFDWIDLRDEKKNEFDEIFRMKIEAGEDPAVAMTWGTEDFVFTFFPNENRINCLLMSQKVRHPEVSDIVDVNRYLALLYKPLQVEGVGVSMVQFSEQM